MLLDRPKDLALLSAKLSSGEQRWTTVVGPPGSGKSTLAEAAVQRFAATHPGPWKRLDLRASRIDVDWHAALAPEFRAQTVLLLDNVDDHFSSLTVSLPALLEEFSDVRVVVTCARRFGHVREVVHYVYPLGFTQSRELFVMSLAAHGADSLPEDPAAFQRVLRSLDGLPLAIQLCARHAVSVPLRFIEAELQHDIHWLTTNGAPEVSQQSLCGAWTRALKDLPGETLSVLRRLALFHDEFCAGDVRAAWNTSPLPHLTLLHEHSLLRYSPEFGTYRLYHTARAHLNHTAPPDSAAVEAFERFLLDGANEHADPGREGPNIAWLLRHGASLLPLLQKVVLAAEFRPRHSGLAIAAGRFAAWCGPAEQTLTLLGSEYITRGLRSDPASWARFLQVRAKLAARLGLHDAAKRDYAQALEAIPSVTDSGGPMEAIQGLELSLLADIAVFQHQQGIDSQPLLAQCKQRLDAAPLHPGRAHVWGTLAHQATEQGLFAEAEAWFERACSAARDDSLPLLEGVLLSNRGVLRQDNGLFDEAHADFSRAQTIHHSVGYRRFEAVAQFDLACLALEQGDANRSQELLESALGLASEAEDSALLGMILCVSGTAFTLLADEQRAGHAFADARVLLERIGNPRLLAAHEVHAAQALTRCALSRFLAGDERGYQDALAEARSALDSPRRITSDELRFAQRLLRRQVNECEALATKAVIARDGSWISSAASALVEFRVDSPHARILQKMVQQVDRNSTTPLSAAELIRVGWPEIRTTDKPAMNRLHVTLNALRKAGLRNHLLHTSEGYLLAHVVPWAVIPSRSQRQY